MCGKDSDRPDCLPQKCDKDSDTSEWLPQMCGKVSDTSEWLPQVVGKDSDRPDGFFHFLLIVNGGWEKDLNTGLIVSQTHNTIFLNKTL